MWRHLFVLRFTWIDIACLVITAKELKDQELEFFYPENFCLKMAREEQESSSYSKNLARTFDIF